jgi:DNA-binding CsgD family transcriptional regulator
MFNVRLFAAFEAPPAAGKPDRLFLRELAAVREETGARFVNYSVYDYRKDNPDAVHFLTYPMDWIVHYVRNFYTGADPLLSVDYRRVAFLDWRDLYSQGAAADILAAFRDMGLGNEGMTIVTHGGNHVYGAMSLVFRCPPAKWPQMRRDGADLFRFQCDRLGEKYLELYSGRTAPQARLTPRERQVLQYVALGHTDEEIAEIMRLGKWTVVSHIQSAKYKLGSSNRTAAVALALSSGLIDYNKAS